MKHNDHFETAEAGPIRAGRGEPAMKYRPFGTTGLIVSEIGFGGWGIGGRTPGATSYGHTDDKTSLAALGRALDLGITFFDTANVYGDGHSEYLIGQVIRDRREQVLLATKAGWDHLGGRADFSEDALRRSLKGSLERLGTDHVDLLQLHNPPLATLRRKDGVLAGLRRLQAEGVIRCFGASMASPAEALVAVRDLRLPSVQVNLNMIDLRACDVGLLEAARKNGAAIIARTPLCFGFLSGEVTESTPFGEGDHRVRWSKEQRRRWTEGARRIFEAVHVPEGQTRAQVALRWCLSHPAVSCVIPGILTPQEAEDNAAASTFGPLSAEEMAAVKRINRETPMWVA